MRQQAAVFQQRDFVRVGQRQIRIVQARQYADALRSEPPRGGKQRMLMGEIEAGGGFIQQQVTLAELHRFPDLRQHAGELHPRPFAARQRRVSALREIRRARCGQCLVDDLTFTISPVMQAGHAAERHHLFDREPETQALALRQHGALTSALLWRPFIEFAVVELNTPVRRGPFARQQSQQRGLARTVGPEHGVHAARFQSQRYRIEQADAANLTAQIAGSERHSVSAELRLRSSRAMKNGPPTSAVRMPMGSSVGASHNRAATSASVSSNAPSSAEAGSSKR